MNNKIAAVLFLTTVLLLLMITYGCQKHPTPQVATAPSPTAAKPRVAKRATKTPSCQYCPVSVDPEASTSLATSDGVAARRAQASCATGIINSFPVPDPICTPGAYNPSVTLAVLQNSAFRTACIRNCVTSESQKAATYDSYGVPHPKNNSGNTQTCELDHLVPLELGGADTLDNIWPQCGPPGVTLPQRYFKQKDLVENYLAAQVKNGAMDLSQARIQIAKDWTQFLDAAKAACTGADCQ